MRNSDKQSAEEAQIRKAYIKGDLVKAGNAAELKRQLRTAAKNTLLKSKQVSIRLAEKDLQKIKRRAAELGIPYQTIIGSLVHQYAEGKIKIPF